MSEVPNFRMSESPALLFCNLLEKFQYHLDNESTEYELISTINEMLTINYNQPNFILHKYGDQIVTQFGQIPVRSTVLIRKASVMIYNIIRLQRINVSPCMRLIGLKWLIRCLQKNEDTVCVDVLRAFQLLIKDNMTQTTNLDDCVFSTSHKEGGILLRHLKKRIFIDPKDDGISIELAGEIRCWLLYSIEDFLAVVLQEKDTWPYMEAECSKVTEMVTSIIYDSLPREELSELNCNNLLLTSMNIFRHICVLSKPTMEKNLGKVLGILRSNLMKGIEGVPKIIPKEIFPSTLPVLPQFEPAHKVSLQKFRKREKKLKQKKENVRVSGRSTYLLTTECLELSQQNTELRRDNLQFSESEVSDVEKNSSVRLQIKYSKLRFSSIVLLSVIALNINKSTVFSFWHAIFPEQEVSLLTACIKEPNIKCRQSALKCIAYLLKPAKRFLQYADNRSNSAAYISFAAAMGDMLVSINNTIKEILTDEKANVVIWNALKTLRSLIEVTPYHRLRSGLVTELVEALKPYLKHSDVLIRTTTMIDIASFISKPIITDEIRNCFGMQIGPLRQLAEPHHIHYIPNIYFEIQNDDDDDDEVAEDEYLETLSVPAVNPNTNVSDNLEENDKKSVELPWLLEMCMNNLGVIGRAELREEDNFTKLETLDTLTVLCYHYNVIKDHLDKIARALEIIFSKPNDELLIHAIKMFDTLGHTLQLHLIATKGNNDSEFFNIFDLWERIILMAGIYIQKTDETVNDQIKSMLCSAFSEMGVYIFEHFSSQKRMYLLSLLLGCTSEDNDINIRANACRTLAIYAIYPSLREDLTHIENTSENILAILNHPNNAVRIKASWALGNMSFLLLENRNNPEKITPELFKRIFNAALGLINDIAKVRANAVRNLGNLIPLLNQTHLCDTEWKLVVNSALISMAVNLIQTRVLKLKWNICYALGNSLKNDFVYGWMTLLDSWHHNAYPALCETLIQSPNYKVCLNAATALRSPSKREYYDPYFELTWKSLFAGLCKTLSTPDYVEVTNKRSLINKICITIAHMTSLSLPTDWIMMLGTMSELNNETWLSLNENMNPDDHAYMISASKKLNEFSESAREYQLTDEQKKALQTLTNLIAFNTN